MNRTNVFTREHYVAAVNKDHTVIKYVPKEFITKELLEMSIDRSRVGDAANYIYPDALKYIPIEYRTQSLCLRAVKIHGSNLEFCQLKTARLCKAAVRNNGLAIQFVPDELLNSKLCQDAVENNYQALYYIKDEFKTTEMCLMALRAHAVLLKKSPDMKIYDEVNRVTMDVWDWIPERLHSEEMVSIPGCQLSKLKLKQTRELCLISVTTQGRNLEHVNPEFRTPEVRFAAVNQNGLALQFVPRGDQTKSLCMLAVEENHDSLFWVCKKYKIDPEVYKIAFLKNGTALKNIPHKYQTYEMCKYAVSLNGKAITYVNPELMTTDLCKAAVENTYEALCRIPADSQYLTYDICLKAVRQKGHAVMHVPERFKTQELYECAVINCAVIDWYNYVHSVPKEFRTDKMLQHALYDEMRTTSPTKKFSILFDEFPIELRTEEMFMKYGFNLKHCKHIPYTLQMCLRAVSIDGMQLRAVPKELRTYEVMMEAVKNDPNALSEVPECEKTYEMCLSAMKMKDVIEYVPGEFMKSELLHEFVQRNLYAIFVIDEALWTHELIMKAITSTSDVQLLFDSFNDYFSNEGYWKNCK